MIDLFSTERENRVGGGTWEGCGPCLREILSLRQLSLALFTNWSLSKLRFNAAGKIRMQMALLAAETGQAGNP